MRCLVTGAMGFVGRHLVAELDSRGNAVVSLGTDEDCDYRVDIRDASAVESAVKDSGAEAVYHLAAVAFVPRANADPEVADAVNRGGTANVLDAAAGVGARSLVVSTGAVYGKVAAEDMPIREDQNIAPVDAYARSKAASEEECERRSGVQEIVRVRPFNLTGPGQATDYVCSDFAGQIAAAEVGGVPARMRTGDLSAERDFSDVRDAVRAYVLALEQGVAGEAYNICSGTPVSMRTILDTLISFASVPVEVETESSRLRPGEVKRAFGSAEKLCSIARWEREYPLERTLADLLDDRRAAVGASASDIRK